MRDVYVFKCNACESCVHVCMFNSRTMKLDDKKDCLLLMMKGLIIAGWVGGVGMPSKSF